VVHCARARARADEEQETISRYDARTVQERHSSIAVPRNWGRGAGKGRDPASRRSGVGHDKCARARIDERFPSIGGFLGRRCAALRRALRLAFSRERYLEPLFSLLCHCQRPGALLKETRACRSERVNNKRRAHCRTRAGRNDSARTRAVVKSARVRSSAARSSLEDLTITQLE